MNVAEFLHSSAERHALNPAVTDVRTGRSLNYGQLAQEAERIGAFLVAQGVTPGQRIGLRAPNSLAYLPAAFGLLATGACLVPLASNLTPAETAQITRQIELNGCLTWPDAYTPPGASGLAGGVCDGFVFQWNDRGAEGPAEFRQLNPCFIRFTSGTTASSKGVVLSHEATAARIQSADCVLRLNEDDRILWVLPLAYHFAVTIVAYVKAGAHVILCPESLPGTLVESIQRFEPSVLYASPLHFERMGNLGLSKPFTCLRLCLSTTAPLTQSVCDRFESAYGVSIGQVYGLIEAGLPCINLRSGGLPASSVGYPVPGYEIAVFTDAGERAGTNVIGEIAIRGDGLFSAYYAPWRLREQVTQEGWFSTGDIGYIDPSGALYLKGRKNAAIFVAGHKFFPEEVEEALAGFPGIKELRVFGRPHTHLGEIPCAEVVLGSGGCNVDALRAHCARVLSPHKVPVEFTVVDAIPKTPGGKILRQMLKGTV